MQVGILGSGLMGGKLGTVFARAGHEVVFSYSHKPFALLAAQLAYEGKGGRNWRIGSRGSGNRMTKTADQTKKGP